MDAIDKIKVKLMEKGMTGAELSRAINLSGSIYSQWNKRKSKPSPATLRKIADYLECDIIEILPDELLGDDATKVTTNSNDLAEELALLRDRPDRRAMLHATRNMTPDQVMKIAAMLDAFKEE